jgi:cyd operon protein YbgT
MWYFAWILGLGLALAFGILNALWHEFSWEGQECDSVDCTPSPLSRV